MSKARLAVGSLVLSASALIGLAVRESYTDNAIIPVPGDVPTKGFGTTTNADGTPVKMGDKTTPVRALIDLLRDASKFEKAVKRCAPVPMTQNEFDAFVDLTYNVGETNFCKSSIPVKLKAGQYEAACRTILDFRKVQGRDCSLAENKRFCGGVWTRRQETYALCVTP